MPNTGAMKQLRGPKHENWPVCDPATRALPCLQAEYGLKSGENGHLARANVRDRWPRCLTNLAQCPVCLEGGVSRWLVGVVGLGVGGGWSCTSAHTRRVGRFFNSSAFEKRAVPRPSGAAPEGLAGRDG
jgi:hypothetical protein